MKRVFIQIPDPPKGKHSGRVHSKTRSDKPEIAIAKVERAVAKRLRKQTKRQAKHLEQYIAAFIGTENE